MARAQTAGRFWTVVVNWIIAGLVGAASFFGLQSTSAQTIAPNQNNAPAAQDDSRLASPFSFIASDRIDPTAGAAGARQSVPHGSGSLILMELRTQRGSAKPGRPLVPDVDPRMKPLGW